MFQNCKANMLLVDFKSPITLGLQQTPDNSKRNNSKQINRKQINAKFNNTKCEHISHHNTKCINIKCNNTKCIELKNYPQLRTAFVGDFLLQDLNAWLEIMEPSKREKLEKLPFNDDKKRSIIGDILARKMLAEKLGFLPNQVKIISNQAGKPMLESGEYYFSIAHSGDLIACATFEKPVGVDLELLRPPNLQEIDLFACEKEKQYILSEQSQIAKRFFEIWTFKEAYYKATGVFATSNVCAFDFDLTRRVFCDGKYVLTVFWDNQ